MKTHDRMKTLTRTETFNSSSELVFDAIDDLGVIGSHMTESSAMMMEQNTDGPGK
jgi:hypothetical protein